MGNLIQLVYSSTATDEMSDGILDEILSKARVSNKSREITGMLLYARQSFIQVLEGDEDKVNAILSKISSDPRHFEIVTHKNESISRRDYPFWSMGYHKLSESEYRNLNNFFPVFNQSMKNELFFKNPNETKKLLLDFILKSRDFEEAGLSRSEAHA